MQPEARQLMQVKRPLMLAHFSHDERPTPAKCGQWFLQFELGMASAPGEEHGLRQPTFLSVTLPGNHRSASELFRTLIFM